MIQLNGLPKLVMSVNRCQLCVGKDELYYVEDEFYEFESLSIFIINRKDAGKRNGQLTTVNGQDEKFNPDE